MDHTTRAVLAQRRVNGAPGEVPGFQPLLGDLELTGAVVTADALPTHGHAAECLVTSKQADYRFTVKANQPVLLDRCERLAWHHVPVLDRTRDHAPGRVELRTSRRHRQPLRLPARRPGPPGHPQDPQPADQAVADRDRPRHHQSHPHPGQPGPACRPHPRALDDRERPALGPGCDLRRGRLPAADRDRPTGHGLPAQPHHRRAQPSRAGQPRRRPPPPRPRPTPTARHPRDHPRMQQTSRENTGALRKWEPGPGRPRAAAGTVRRCRRCR
jgi:hypothetical protein